MMEMEELAVLQEIIKGVLDTLVAQECSQDNYDNDPEVACVDVDMTMSDQDGSGTEIIDSCSDTIEDENSHELVEESETEIIPLIPGESQIIKVDINEDEDYTNKAQELHDEILDIEELIIPECSEVIPITDAGVVVDTPDHEDISDSTVNLNDDMDNKTSLMRASLMGQSSEAELIIQTGGQINAQNSKGETPLILAAKNGHLETVLLLLSCGATVEMTDDEGNSALMHATIGNHSTCITALLKHGSSMTQTNKLGLSPFRVAVSEGHSNAQKALAQFLQESGFCDFVKKATLEASSAMIVKAQAQAKIATKTNDLKSVTKIIEKAKKQKNDSKGTSKTSNRGLVRATLNRTETQSTKVENKIPSQVGSNSKSVQQLKKLPSKQSTIQSVITGVRKEPKRLLKSRVTPLPPPNLNVFQPGQQRNRSDFQLQHRFPNPSRNFNPKFVPDRRIHEPGPGFSFRPRAACAYPGSANQSYPINFNMSGPGHNSLGFPGPQNFPQNNNVQVQPQPQFLTRPSFNLRNWGSYP